MAVKLGKCRLCLKLGDFCSIFTMDNDVKLSDMVMSCTSIKVYEGDGLSDKVCVECIQKLSSAYILKQQCERADQEQRRTAVCPPSSNTQSSVFIFSSDSESSCKESKVTPVNRSRSQEYHHPTKSNRVEKRRRTDSSSSSTSGSSYVSGTPEMDLYDILIFNNTKKVLKQNVHRNETSHEAIPAFAPIATTSTSKNTVNNTSVAEDKDKENCPRCDKTFKLRIMLKIHLKSCQGKTPKLSVTLPQKGLKLTFKPAVNRNRSFT